MTDYYILITDAGAALEAAAHASGTTVELASFGVCDGGVEFTPDPTLTTFANEVYSGPISSLVVSSDDPTVLVTQCVIPASSGGYTIRGIALYASDGTLYATGNYPDQQKPAADSGYSASLEILAQLAVSDTADITLQVTDGSYLTEQEADTLYLRQENNLSDLTDVQAARSALELGSAATHGEDDFLSTSGGTVDGALIVTGNTTTGGLSIEVSSDTWGGAFLDNKSDLGSLFFNFSFNGVLAGGLEVVRNGDGTLSTQLTSASVAGTDDRTVGFYVNHGTGSVGSGPGYILTENGARAYSANNPQPLPQIVSDMAFGAAVQSGAINNNQTYIVPTGCVGCGVDKGDPNLHSVWYKPTQKLVNGAWVTISG